MDTPESLLKETVEGLLETLPPVWDRIRSNLRAAGTGKFGITLEQFHVPVSYTHLTLPTIYSV